MTLRLHNTLTRRTEPFAPLHPGRVSLYTCGPTIYNYAHLGNFRTFLFEDLLRRWLEASGFDVFHVMNLTDVDDRTIAAAHRRGVSLREHVEPFALAFFEDRDYLRIRPAHAYPRATEYVPAMVRLIEDLLAKGVAYVGEDGSVYFAIARFPAYGRLSRLDARGLRAGGSARVSTDEYAKEDARDFALWKAADPEAEAVGAAWDAPFGRGRPGWHIECSAMALALLRERWGEEVLDIHAGGVDLIFPHHEDEIAQSCAHTGRELFARVWLHGEFLHIRGEKMSKRFGNITTARDLREDGVDAAAFRLLVFQAHYRQRLDLTDDGLAAAREGARRLGEFRRRLGEARAEADAPAFAAAAERLEREVAAALDDDLNAPRAVAALFQFAGEGHAALDAGERPGPRAVGAWDWADGILDVTTRSTVLRVGAGGAARGGGTGVTGTGEVARPSAGSAGGGGTAASGATASVAQGLEETPPAGAGEAAEQAWALEWAQQRRLARGSRNFAEADRIRALLRTAGWEVRDARDGSVEVVRTGQPAG